MGLPTLVNYLTIVANCIGFGKPYSIAYAASEYPDRTSTIVNDLIRRKNGRSLSQYTEAVYGRIVNVYGCLRPYMELVTVDLGILLFWLFVSRIIQDCTNGLIDWVFFWVLLLFSLNIFVMVGFTEKKFILYKVCVIFYQLVSVLHLSFSFRSYSVALCLLSVVRFFVFIYICLLIKTILCLILVIADVIEGIIQEVDRQSAGKVSTDKTAHIC